MDKNALFEFKTDGKRTSLKVNAMTGDDVTNVLLRVIEELNEQRAVNLVFLRIGLAMINEQEEEVMEHAQGKA